MSIELVFFVVAPGLIFAAVIALVHWIGRCEEEKERAK